MSTETTDPRPSFLGIEVHGEITPGAQRKEQRPITELAPIIQAVLDDPTVESFGWTQYTPYFNDGDPCEFDAHGVWVRLVDAVPVAEGDASDEDEEDEEGRVDIDCADEALGDRPVLSWEGTWPNRQAIFGTYVGPDEARYDRLHALKNAIEDNEFDDVLLHAFGDHAEIRVRRDGIQVDFYSHD